MNTHSEEFTEFFGGEGERFRSAVSGDSENGLPESVEGWRGFYEVGEAGVGLPAENEIFPGEGAGSLEREEVEDRDATEVKAGRSLSGKGVVNGRSGAVLASASSDVDELDEPNFHRRCCEVIEIKRGAKSSNVFASEAIDIGRVDKSKGADGIHGEGAVLKSLVGLAVA